MYINEHVQWRNGQAVRWRLRSAGQGVILMSGGTHRGHPQAASARAASPKAAIHTIIGESMAVALLLCALSPVRAAIASSFTSKSNYIRLQRTRDALELQTASVSLALMDRETRKPFELSLLSTVHLAEPPYYAALQRACDEYGYDRILYELLVDETSVSVDEAGARRLSVELQPSPGLAAMAARNRLTTQVGALDCQRDGRWVLADVSRTEWLEKEADAGFGAPFADAPARLKLIAPLRSLLTSGPPKDTSDFRPSPLRLLLALLPAPEAALLLDDWIASRGAAPAPVLLALSSAISRFDWGVAGRLSFAQTLASGESTQAGSLAGALVRWRNARAIEEVDRALAAGCAKVALLYGALHMRDLRAKLQAKYKLVGVSEPQWNTAWSIPLPPDEVTDAIESGVDPRSALAMLRGLLTPLLALLLLLAVDASDWLGVVGSFIHALPTDQLAADANLIEAYAGFGVIAAPADAAPGSAGEAVLSAALYMLRHAILYLALERWVFEWDARWWAVESSDE